MAEHRITSPLWHKALEKYKEELQTAADYQDIQKVHTLEQLMDSFSSIQDSAPTTYTAVLSFNSIAPRLKFIDDFAAVLALLILSHAASAADTFQDVLDMLEELSLTLPRLQIYEQTIPLNRQLQQSLLDIYSDIICFYARTIHFLRSNPHPVLRKNAWQIFHHDFSRTN